MGVRVLIQRLCYFEIRRLVLVIGLIVATVVLVQFYAIPYRKSLSNSGEHSIDSEIGNVVVPNNLTYDLISGNEKRNLNESLQLDESSENTQIGIESKSLIITNDRSVGSGSRNSPVREDDRDLENGAVKEVRDSRAGSRTSFSFSSPTTSSFSNDQQRMELHHEDRNTELSQTGSVEVMNNLRPPSILIMKKRGMHTTSISRMNSLLVQSLDASHSRKQRWFSVRDRELLSAKLEIENAPIVGNSLGLYASVFRNVSVFRRSYELMEQVLKVYVYKEGEKPIFHQPQLRGIYASEGWFMKLLEGNKQFVVGDPKKAHLFYLPFSSKKLRTVLGEQNSSSWKDMEKYLSNYVDFIAEKYPFWNRTGGADHFLVACHDWASKITKRLKNCIRVLCNANVSKDFKIGKDTTLPVTYIRKSEDPLRDLGGKSPTARPILAFFAGSMHGYLRPILLEYWGNKKPDMKIFDSMPRSTEGQQNYRDHMKSSKYCICPRGYEVHTPRVIESISYECVPVIISDNYVPPFFEVLNWETFSVFIQEKDIPNLRNILLSIPEKKYLAMQMRVKMVQKHFLWHKKPVKYDLFHMILHSIWYNRIFR